MDHTLPAPSCPISPATPGRRAQAVSRRVGPSSPPRIRTARATARMAARLAARMSRGTALAAVALLLQLPSVQAQEPKTAPAANAAPAATPATPAAPAAEASRAEGMRNAAGIAQRAASALEAARPGPFSAAEQAFMQSALRSSSFEIEAGRIGMQRGTDPAVKNLAQMLAADHGAAGRELDGMARRRGAPLAAAMTTEQQKTLANLRTTAAFDTVFLRLVGVQAHQTDIALFDEARQRISDPELKAWVAEKLPTLREHLSTAQKIPLRNAADRTPNSGRNSEGPAPSAPGVRP